MNETIKNNFTVPTANMEPDSCNAPLAEKKTSGLDTRCSIHLHSKRNRLADPDGISGKAVIDGLQHAGILTDDSSKEISGVTFSQEKTKGREETEIILTWGGHD